MNIITGEKIQELCDHYLIIPNPQSYHNPYFNETREKYINLNELDNYFENGKKIFCLTHALKILKTKIHFFKNPFVLVAGNSDNNFNEEFLPLLENTKIIKIISQNIDLIHDKLLPLPIGLANRMWPHGNLNIFHDGFGIPKSKNIYFYFSMWTSRDKRMNCYNKLIKKGLKFGKQMIYSSYVKELASHKFAICPDGNGIDTHRLWECLYLKVIPICLRSISTEYFSKDFPIILLDDWDDLNIYSLNYRDYDWNNYEKLNLNYYKTLINSFC